MPKLVLVHGWGCDHRVWDPLLPALDASDCLALDLNPMLSAAADAKGLLAMLAASTPANATWVGSSLGGTLCSLLAEANPDHVRSVVTIGTSPSFVQRDGWPHAMDAGTFAGFAAGLETDPVRTCQRFQALATRGDRTALRTLATLTAHLKVRLPALQLGLSILQETDLRAHWRAPSKPHLAIFGQHDALVPAGAQRACDEQDGVRTQLVDSHHLPWLGAPQQVAAAIQDFAPEAAST